MRRLLFTTAATLSLLLFVATVALWARSYFVADAIEWRYLTSYSGVSIRWGRCWCYWTGFAKWPGPGPDRPTSRQHMKFRPAPPPAWNRTWSGFYWGGFYNWIDVAEPRRRRGSRHLAVPFWAIALATAVLPARWLVVSRRRRRAERRARAGRCVACGYDLTGNTSGACPECGRPRSPTNAATYSSSATPARTSTATRA